LSGLIRQPARWEGSISSTSVSHRTSIIRGVLLIRCPSPRTRGIFRSRTSSAQPSHPQGCLAIQANIGASSSLRSVSGDRLAPPANPRRVTSQPVSPFQTHSRNRQLSSLPLICPRGSDPISPSSSPSRSFLFRQYSPSHQLRNTYKQSRSQDPLIAAHAARPHRSLSSTAHTKQRPTRRWNSRHRGQATK